MITKGLNPNVKMKDSGIEWLGLIPEHWEVKRLKFISIITMGQSPNSNDYNLKGDGVPFLQGNADFTQEFPNAKTFCKTANKYANKGDILLSVRAPVGALNIANQIYGIGRGLCSITFLDKQLFRRFSWYLIQGIKFQLNFLVTGSTYEGVSVNDVSNLFCTIPPLNEQKAIALFLDEKTKQIDELINKKEKLIKLLEEKRTALISHTVTKGLNPNVKMKDSGIEWLGFIPEHWQVKRLRYIGSCQNGVSKGAEYFGSGYPFVNYTDVYINLELPKIVSGLAQSTDVDRKNYSVKVGDIFFTRTSETIEEIGLTSTCLNSINNAIFSGFLIRVRPFNNLLFQGFSKYYFRSKQHRLFFVKEMNIVTRASLSQELLKKLPVLLPPLNEQKAIALFLDRKTQQIDKLIKKTRDSIKYLKEYRTALISAAVTGKIDVREIK